MDQNKNNATRTRELIPVTLRALQLNSNIILKNVIENDTLDQELKSEDQTNYIIQNKDIFNKVGIDLKKVEKQQRVNLAPPWNELPFILRGIKHTKNKKEAKDKEIVKKYKTDIQELNQFKDYVIYTDGSVLKHKGNRAGSASIIKDIYNQTITTLKCRCTDGISTLQTELVALLITLKYFETNNQWEKIIIHTDSLSAIQALKHTYTTNSLIIKIHNLAKSLKKEITINYVPSHIGIIGNEEADSAAKEAAEKSLIDLNIKKSIYCYRNACHKEIIKRTKPNKAQIDNSASLTWYTTIKNKIKIEDLKYKRKIQTELYKLKFGYKTYNDIKEIPTICDNCKEIKHTSIPSLIHYIHECPITSQLFTTRPKIFINEKQRHLEAAKTINKAFEDIERLTQIIKLLSLPQNQKIGKPK